MKMLMTIAALLAASPSLAQTQAEMNRQAGAALKSADATMTATWRTTYAGMKRRDAAMPTRGGGFGYAAGALESQRAWLKFRDAQSMIESAEFAGGSMQPTARTQCLTRLTLERTRQLGAMQCKR